MSYNPKTKIIELDKVIIDGEEFCLTSKDNEELNRYNNLSKIEKKEDKKSEWIIASIVGAIVLGLAIWMIFDPVNAILKIMLYGFVYVMPAVLIIKCILAMLLPPKPKIYDIERVKKMHRLSRMW